eukprot:TRINITY_DN75422_c0_g1_i1.p1 TRINITY_DN75422_c0_g1~~TRINITY_DN75422_c0_g1_i1.p1  ORF type:complete len:418 (+),score=30.00 TRINITY_DN75422_c0_g1_i1:58-1311(+)
MSTTTTLVVASLVSVAKLSLVSLVGFLCGVYPRGEPILSKSASANLSRLLVNIVWPAWAFSSIGFGIKREELLTSLPLFPWCIFTTCVALSLGFISARVCRIDPELKMAYIVACGFQNSLALPIMLLGTLCEQSVLSHIPNCTMAVHGYLNIYNVLWSLAFFAIGVPLLESIPVHDDGDVASPEAVKASDPEKDVATDVVGVSTQGISIEERAPSRPCASLIRRCGGRILTALSTPVMISIYLGLFVSLVPGLQAALFDQSGALLFVGSAVKTVGEPGVAGFTFVMAASLAPSKELRQRFSAKRWPMSPKALIALLMSRLLLIPLVCFSAWYLVEFSILRPVAGSTYSTAPLIGLISLTASASPSANMPIVFLAKMNKHDVATRLAFGYVFMYPVATFTMVGFTSVALDLAVVRSSV